MKPTLVAALAISALSLAACASNPPGKAPASRSTSAAHEPAGRVVRADTAAGNKAHAVARSQSLVSLMSLPPGSVRFTGKPPSTLDYPSVGISQTQNLVDTTTYWRVPSSVDATQWATLHQPHGFKVEVRATGSDSDGISFTAPSDPAAPQNEPGTLAVSSARFAAGNSLWRIDGEVIWYDPTPVKAPAEPGGIHITLAGGCPHTFTGIRNTGPGLDEKLLPAGNPTQALVCQFGSGTAPPLGQASKHWLLSAAQARNLADQVRRLRVGSTGGVYNCPMDDGRAIVIVFAMGQGDIDIAWRDSGCQSVDNGLISSFMGSLNIPG